MSVVVPKSISNSHIAFFIADYDLNVKWINEAYTDLTGCDLHDVENSGWKNYVKDSYDMVSIWNSTLDKGLGAFHVSSIWTKPDGSCLNFETYTVRNNDSDHICCAIMETFGD